MYYVLFFIFFVVIFNLVPVRRIASIESLLVIVLSVILASVEARNDGTVENDIGV